MSGGMQFISFMLPRAIPQGFTRSRAATLTAPRRAKPLMLSRPLVFINSTRYNFTILRYEIPQSTVMVINRIALKCWPQFPVSVLPGQSPSFRALVDGVPIAQGTGDIIADNTEDRNTRPYVPPRWLNVQWSAQGPAVFDLSFTYPPANLNSYYLYCVAQGFTYFSESVP